MGDNLSPRELGELDLDPKKDGFVFFMYVLACVFLVCMAGLMSGLTLGLLSLDTLDLEVRRVGCVPSPAALPRHVACRVRLLNVAAPC